MLEIAFLKVEFDRPATRNSYDVLLGVIADIAVRVDDCTVYREELFSIVELRVAFGEWLTAIGLREDFEFTSLDAEESGLIWFRRQPSGRWMIGSVHQETCAPREVEEGELLDACAAYNTAVDKWVRENLGIEVPELFNV